MKKAFTLIELLVVIAIIAILAAILFPVFAQAKAAAKASVALSDAKQMGTSVLIYMGDADDLFPPATITSPPGNFDTWQGATYPYSKNWGIEQHPLLKPFPSDTTTAAWYYQARSHWGMPTRGAANSGYQAPTATANGNWTFTSASQTAGKTALLDGIAGQAMDPAVPWGNRVNTPSLSQTAVNNISDQVMISEGGLWDYGWGFLPATPMNYFFTNGTWTNTALNVDTNNYCGPHARKNKQSYSGYGSNSGTLPWPDGMTTYVATDGSAKSVNWRGRITELITLGTGQYALKRMYPNGQ